MTASARPSTTTRRPSTTSATPQSVVGPAVAPESGYLLVKEGRELVAARKWKHAIRTLQAAARFRPDDREVDGLLLVAGAHANKRRVAELARNRLSETITAAALTSSSAAYLANRDYQRADTEARRALEIEPNSTDAWECLAGAYAGLGWFNEARQCMDKASTPHGDSRSRHWQIGQAINLWALAKSYGFSVALAVVFLGGLLAVPLAIALGVTTPFLVREYRIAHLDQEFRLLAHESWHGMNRLRIGSGLLVWAATLTWMVLPSVL